MIEFVLNGNKVVSSSPSGLRLLDVIREEFGFTGTKEGCSEGECGACSVLVDGKLFDSCLVALGSIAGKEIITIEGFKKLRPERFNMISDSYAKSGAVQCGICIPGMVMATEALLSANPKPTEEEIRTGLSGNLCRCTGYNMIVDAVKMASKEGEGLW
ncbi:(2Fe-2S)-binding protein [Microaceticoccus formicicus]|uniref:(2Fe-2S)-binding protein n=1 Tax=Microaceticoccus formicicus TaxID=3118105 RepID=UPI003CD0249D|nr:(2Fe-2S)-binding protein [Peptoniphilaceae bacterium AMB_02]